MYRFARVGNDPEQPGLEVSEHGLLVAWPWLGTLGLL